MVWMQFDEMKTAEGVPSIVIMNSHNRSSSLKFHTGFIRWACSNLLVGGSDITSLSLRHSENWTDKASVFLDGYIENVEVMMQEHERMKSKCISRYQMMQLAEQAVQLRYKLDDVLDPNELNLIRREEDRGSDLYTSYNRIQEALLQGHFKRKVQHVNDEGNLIVSPYSNAKRITATDETLRLNKELRALVLEVA